MKQIISKGLIIGALLILVMTISACSFMGGKTFDCSLATTVEFTGTDGYGTANLSIDRSSLDIDTSNISESELSEVFSYAVFVDSIKLDNYSFKGLSNGDVIEAEISYDAELAKKYNVNFANTKLTFTVSGLKEPQTVDVFEMVDVTFSGISPLASAKITNNNTDAALKYVQITADKNENLKNGDEITLTATYEATALAENGYKLTADTKTVQVQVDSTYIIDPEQFTAEAKTYFEKEAYDLLALKTSKFITEKVDTWDSTGVKEAVRAMCEDSAIKSILVTSIDEIKLNSYYLCVNKDPSSVGGWFSSSVVSSMYYFYDVKLTLSSSIHDNEQISGVIAIWIGEPLKTSAGVTFDEIEYATAYPDITAAYADKIVTNSIKYEIVQIS